MYSVYVDKIHQPGIPSLHGKVPGNSLSIVRLLCSQYNCINPQGKYFDFLSTIPLFIRIWYFTNLLPSLDVPAVSQAPSLEQNPIFLLLLDVSVVHYTPDYQIGHVLNRILKTLL